MKFLVDAHLPPRLCAVLNQHGHDALHTSQLPDQNATKDRIINQVSLAEERISFPKTVIFSTRICCRDAHGSCSW